MLTTLFRPIARQLSAVTISLASRALLCGGSPRRLAFTPESVGAYRRSTARSFRAPSWLRDLDHPGCVPVLHAWRCPSPSGALPREGVVRVYRARSLRPLGMAWFAEPTGTAGDFTCVPEVR